MKKPKRRSRKRAAADLPPVTGAGDTDPGAGGDPDSDGAQGALLNLRQLRFGRAIGAIRFPTIPAPADVYWKPAPGLGIQRSDPQQAWFSGHINAILSDGVGAIIGADSGGVWVVNPPRPDAIPSTGSFDAFCVSDDWDFPDVNCLAYAPGATDQFFAGCRGDSGPLYFVELQYTNGRMAPKRSTLIPIGFTTSDIQAMIVLEKSRRLVVACGFGVFWSPISDVPSDASSYQWQSVDGSFFTSYSGLAEGPDESIVAAVWGLPSTVPLGYYGLFVGTLQGNNYLLSRVPADQMGGVDPAQMSRTSLASYDADRSILYAVAADSTDEDAYAVLASADGGNSWTAVTIPKGATGQGFYNNCIAVSPFNPDVVTIGWRSGPYVSTDAGKTWAWSDDSNHSVHSDLHALYFSRNKQRQDQLFIGDDGGISVTRDLGQTYEGRYNKRLATLQIYRGQLSVSSRYPGLIAASTQDNGNLYCNLQQGEPSWGTFEEGDGGAVRFLDPVGALVRFGNTTVAVRITFWDPVSASFGPDTILPVDGDAGGLSSPFLDVVFSPAWKKSGQLMYAVAAEPQAGPPDAPASLGKVYGMFANPDGTQAGFSLVAQTEGLITAVASRDGSSLWVAKQDAGIISIDSSSKAVTDLGVPLAFADSGSFVRMACLEPGRAFALHGSGVLLHFDGSNWIQAVGGGFLVFEADPRPGSRRVFAASDSAVFVSEDNGGSWANMSNVLPARPHCTDLRLANDGNGGHDLYLATYGRSTWVTKVDFLSSPTVRTPIPPAVLDVIAGVLEGGGGLVRVGSHILRIPPSAPVTDILGALAAAEIANSLSISAKHVIRLAAMKVVRDAAESSIKRLTEGAR